MDQNPSQPDSRNDWQPCPAGTLQSLGSELRGRKLRRTMSIASAAAAGLFAVAVAVFATLPGAAPPAPIAAPPSVPPVVTVADISCRDVRANAKAYLAGGVAGDLKARIDKHLGKCGSCEKFVAGQRTAKHPCDKPCKPHQAPLPTIASR